jgi:hypothetical protein
MSLIDGLHHHSAMLEKQQRDYTVMDLLDQAADKIEAQDKRIAELTAALRPYADRSMWHKEVIDSYSGEMDWFDWPGDLQDEPYEVAENALAAAEDKP